MPAQEWQPYRSWYMATWAFSSAVNERYWPRFFVCVSAWLVTEDRVDQVRGPYQSDTGSKREP